MATGMKTGGRSKGTPNKKTTEVKDKIADLLGQYQQDQMISDFMELKASERLKLFSSLAEFLAPKHNRTTVEVEDPESTEDSEPDYDLLNFEELSQLRYLIGKAHGEEPN